MEVDKEHRETQPETSSTSVGSGTQPLNTNAPQTRAPNAESAGGETQQRRDRAVWRSADGRRKREERER